MIDANQRKSLNDFVEGPKDAKGKGKIDYEGQSNDERSLTSSIEGSSRVGDAKGSMKVNLDMEMQLRMMPLLKVNFMQ